MSIFRRAVGTASCLRLGAQACRPITVAAPFKSATQAATPAIRSRGLSSESSGSPPTYQPPSGAQWSVVEGDDSDAASLAAAASAAAAAANVNWTTSFYGVSSRPVTEEQFQVLMKPVPESDIEVKPDGIIYLPEIKFRRRLNEAFGPMGWGLIPKGDPVVGQAVVTREYALIANGRFVSQAQGENTFFNADQLPSAVEGCKSNALTRCCKDLGIGSELWDPQYVRWFKKNHMEEVWVEHQVTKKKRAFWYRKGMVDVSYPYKIAPKSNF
ncbi:hypothetical protein XA68_16810 [Ophiocordyceps unilateralis]|uniref:Mitochondrial genome maintenance protein MGM101 n=1 Tax=Ophiocordyceps unilateralis TaxID=268505 RepID=A0A2A9PJG3_OPHUN|nr:hypothetical protein XA68_16810 [Ophiocordyceps unilateralis]